MNFSYSELKKLNDFILKYENKIKIAEQINKNFELKFTHESTKIEGNSLTIFEVKTILEDGYSIGGKELREIYEVINNQKAFNFIKLLIKDKENLTEEIIKDLHEILLENIFQGGIYRNANVRITGASFIPPNFENVRQEMKYFIEDYNKYKSKFNPIKLSAFVHAEFVRIHPFADGNGRTSRLLMNYCLMNNNFKPISINPENRAEYYESLDIYGKNKTLKSLENFENLILQKEYETLLEYKQEIEKSIIINGREL